MTGAAIPLARSVRRRSFAPLGLVRIARVYPMAYAMGYFFRHSVAEGVLRSANFTFANLESSCFESEPQSQGTKFTIQSEALIQSA